MISKSLLSITFSSLLAVSLAYADGNVSGKVTLDGKPPAEKPIDFSADATCSAHAKPNTTTRHYVVDAAGGLANVFVYVKDGLKTKVPPSKTAVLLDQASCLYQPYVIGVQTGQTLTIQNSDGTMHNVNALAKVNAPFNIAQPTKGAKNDKVFDKTEVFVKFKCDVHPWMFAYVGVVDNPFFAVTGADGSFKLTGLPDGEYTIAAKHPKIDVEQTFKVKVSAGAEGKADFKFAPKAQ